MNILGKVERGLEQGVQGAFSKLFRTPVKAVDIASALRRCVDDHATVISGERTVIPNQFVIHLSPSDLSAFSSGDPSLSGVITAELTDNLTNYATNQRYSFVGPVDICLTKNTAQATGTITITPSTKRGAVAPATATTASATHPIIEIGSEKWLLTEPVTVIGRGSEADIVLNDSGISRKHLELRITPTGVIATDLGSTNGSFVEGNRISAVTLLDSNEITIGRTTIFFWTSPLDPAEPGSVD